MQIGESVSVAPPSHSAKEGGGEFEIVEVAEVVMTDGAEQRQNPRGRKQYVNLDANSDPSHPHAEFGRVIKLRVRVAWVSASESRSPGGQPVNWRFVAASGNRGGLTGDDREGFDGPGGAGTKTVTTDDDGWTPIVEFFLSRYGGDEFDVYASLTAASSSADPHFGTYVVWRRLFYDILEMKKADGNGKYELPLAIQSRVKAAFEDVFLELKDTGKRALGDYHDNFEDVEKGFKWADPYCATDEVPLKLHICVVDHATPLGGPYGAMQKQIEEDADTPRFRSTSKIYPYDFSGNPWLIKSEHLDGTEWKELAAKVTLDGTRGDRSFIVDFAGTALAPTVNSKVKVRLTYLQAGKYGGWGGSNSLHLLICRGTYEEMMPRANADQQIAVACIHEPGHAMGLVDTAAAWHDLAHSAHCTHRSCTMWFASTPGNERFHPESVSDPGCRTALRQRNLDKHAMQSAWKFPR